MPSKKRLKDQRGKECATFQHSLIRSDSRKTTWPASPQWKHELRALKCFQRLPVATTSSTSLTAGLQHGTTMCGIKHRYAPTCSIWASPQKIRKRPPLHNIHTGKDHLLTAWRGPPWSFQTHPHTCDSLGRRSKCREQGAIMTQRLKHQQSEMKNVAQTKWKLLNLLMMA